MLVTELSKNEVIALKFLHWSFCAGNEHVLPRYVGRELAPTACNAAPLGGRVCTELVRKGLARRSTPLWNCNAKSPYYVITTAGRDVAASIT